jgi:hypothetical protein
MKFLLPFLFTFVTQFIRQNLARNISKNFSAFIFLKAGRKDKQWALIDKSFLRSGAETMRKLRQGKVLREIFFFAQK